MTCCPSAEVYGLSEDLAVREGRMLSDKAPGLALLAVPVVWIVAPFLPTTTDGELPAYWPVRHLLTALLAALPAVAAAWLVGLAVAPAGTGRGEHDHSTLAVALSLATPLLTYGTVLFGHALAAGLVAAAWMPLLARWRRGEILDARVCLACGLAAGFAICTEYPTAILTAVLGTVVALDRRGRLRARAAFCGGLALGLLPVLVVHQFAFGAPWRTGYSFKAAPDFQHVIDRGFFGVATPSLDGLWGVLASSERGLLWYSPVLLLALVGLAWGARDRRRGTLALASAVGLYIAFAAGFVDWRAGWCAAARHLTPVVPLLVLLTVDGIRELSRSITGTVFTVVLATVAITHTMLSVALTPFFPIEFDAPLTQLVVPSLSEGLAAPTVIGALTGTPDIAVWLVAILVALTVMTASMAAVSQRRVLAASVAVLTLVAHSALLVAAAAHRPASLEPYRVAVIRFLGLDPSETN